MSEAADPYEVWDVNDWVEVGREADGEARKRWISPDPEENPKERWLMKWVTTNKDVDGSVFLNGDDWAERIACAVAAVLGVPSARVELATRGVEDEPDQPPEGIVCKSFLGKWEKVIPGNQVLKIAGEETYTPEAVMDMMQEVAGPQGPEELSAQAAFAGYLLLDATIGNADRHLGNWGIVEDASGEWRLAPSYDHASCLGFFLSDIERSERLEDQDGGYTPEAYASSAESPFSKWRGGRWEWLGVREVAEEVMRLLSQEERELWQERLLAVDAEALLHCVRSVPEGRMSGPARRFAERMLRYNFEAMSHLLRSLKV